MKPRNILRFGFFISLTTLPFFSVSGCSTSGDSTGAAGTSSTGSAGTGAAGTGTAGISATGTAGTSAAGTNGQGTAGTAAAGTNGQGTAGTAAAGAGAAGTGAAGAATAGTSAGGTSAGIEVVDFTTPGTSGGCGKAPDLTGPTLAPYNGMTFYKRAATFTGKGGVSKMAEYLIALPANYAMGTPSKLAFVMGGYTRDAIDCIYGDCWGFANQGHAAGAIVVSMTQTNTGALHPPQTGDPNNAPVKTGWELTQELEDNMAFFKQAKADILAAYCVDTKHVFVGGGSSGADMALILGCQLGNELRGVASVGGCMANTIAPAPGTSPVPAPARGTESYANICLKTVDFSSCKGNVAVMMVHGFEDPHIPWADARITRDKGWVPKNGCQAGTTPDIDVLHTTITAGTVIVPPPGMWNTPKVPNKIMCSDANGCATDYPVRWCEHSDPGYDNSTHGWPAGNTGTDGAGKTIWDFWKTLK